MNNEISYHGDKEEFCPGIENCPTELRNCKACTLYRHALAPTDPYRQSVKGGYYSSEIHHWIGEDGKEHFGYNRP